MDINVTNGTSGSPCDKQLPFFREIIDPTSAELAVYILAPALALVIFAIYIYQTIRSRPIEDAYRGYILIILSFPLVLSVICVVSVFLPRSVVIVNLVINLYTAFVLYTYLTLTESGWYLSVYGHQGSIIKLPLRAPPLCMFCCLPVINIRKSTYSVFRGLFLQMIIIRPTIMIILAVLWNNDNVLLGVLSPELPYLYLKISDVVSTLCGVYGIIQIFRFHQQQGTRNGLIVTKPILLVILSILTALLNSLSGFLVRYDVLPCQSPFYSISRGERLYHMLIIVVMLPMALVGNIICLKPFLTNVPQQPTEKTKASAERNHAEASNTTQFTAYDNEGNTIGYDNLTTKL